MRRVSKRRARENRERRKMAHATHGARPRCSICPTLRDAGIDTGCDGWADDLDEPLRRAQGGSITDPAASRPVGRRCHDWLGANPYAAHDLGLTVRGWER